LQDCPGRDLWYDVKLRFDTPDPLQAEGMSVWLGVPDPTHDICDWVPSGQFTGPYRGERVAAPRSETQPAQPGGSGETDEPGEVAPAAPHVAVEGPAKCTAGRRCAFTVTLARDATAPLEGLSLFAVEVEPARGMRLSADAAEGLRCIADGPARQLCWIESDELAPGESVSLPLTLRTPSGGVRGGKLRLCARGMALTDLPDRSIARLVQDHLRALGLYKGAIDGLVGPKTRAAIAGFASAHGLAADTRFDDPALLAALLGPVEATAAGESCTTTRLQVRPRPKTPKQPAKPQPKAEAEPARTPARPKVKIPCPPNFEPGPLGGCQLKMPTMTAPVEPME
ncbi:MAG: peptidoglycan-binding protein, partial [Alphaproteobacteria bacterium]